MTRYRSVAGREHIDEAMEKIRKEIEALSPEEIKMRLVELPALRAKQKADLVARRKEAARRSRAAAAKRKKQERNT